MKHILSLTILLTFSFNSFGQNSPIATDKKTDLYNYHTLEDKPLFGDATNQEESEKLLDEYVQERIDSLELKKDYKAYISFEIHTDGSVQNVQVSYGKDKKVNEKVVEIISELPKWKPASKNEELVKSSFLIEVKN